jgi:hypothetical protein
MSGEDMNSEEGGDYEGGLGWDGDGDTEASPDDFFTGEDFEGAGAERAVGAEPPAFRNVSPAASVSEEEEAAEEKETDTGPEFSFNALKGYQRREDKIIILHVPTEFCTNAAKNAKRDLCYKHGQGMMYDSSEEGVWREDIGNSKLLNYLVNLAEKYRSTWGEDKTYPVVVKMCRRLESPAYIRNDLLPMVRDMLVQSGKLFDADPYSINCGGIAVNLHTGRQRQARRFLYQEDCIQTRRP